MPYQPRPMLGNVRDAHVWLKDELRRYETYLANRYGLLVGGVITSEEVRHVEVLTQAMYDALTPDPSVFYILVTQAEYDANYAP